MTVNAARELLTTALETLQADDDSPPYVHVDADKLRRALAELRDLPEPYEPEHTRPEPVTVGARRALESIRDMTSDHDVSRSVGVMERIHEAALRGLESIEQLAGNLTDAHLERMEAAATARPAQVDPDAPDPTIEVLPLPGDRYLLILSSWPTKPDADMMQRVSTQCGAEVVLAVPHPVFIR